MCEEPDRKSPGGLWVTLAVALPVFYLVSLPWVGVARWKMGFRDSGAVYDVVCKPWDWLEDNAFLKQPLLDYEMRCWKVAGAG